jgi:hypothetical protein
MAFEADFAIGPQICASAPSETNPAFFGALDKPAMEFKAANADARSALKLGGDQIFLAAISIGEVDAVELATGTEFHAQPGELGPRIGHQPFPARLVDRRKKSFDNGHVQPSQAESNGGGEAGGASADHQSVTGLAVNEVRTAWIQTSGSQILDMRV